MSEDEKVKFDVICGDFNIDNLSPSDQLAAGNRLFSEYSDPAAVRTPGADQVFCLQRNYRVYNLIVQSWAVGTEMRQLRLNTEEMQDKEEFREILQDDVRRRHYVIDCKNRNIFYHLLLPKLIL